MRLLPLIVALVLNSDGVRGINFGRMMGSSTVTKARREPIIHHDASTGTITELTPEQEGKVKSAFTCDNVLVKSLVQANEAKDLAETERNTLQVQLKARDTHILDLNSDLVMTQKVLDSNHTEIKRLVGIAAAERKAFQEEADKIASQRIAAHEESLNDLIASLRLTIQDMETTHTQTINDKDSDISSILQKSIEEKENLLKQHEETTSRLILDHNDHTLSLLDEHQKAVAALKEEISIKEKKATDEMATKDRTMENKLKLLKQKSESQLSAVESDHGKEKSNLLKTIGNLENDISKMRGDINKLQKKFESARDELANWEDLHGSRSYCNLTHISEDTWAATVATSKVASEHVAVGAAYVAKVSEPHVKTAQQLYEEHVKEHVDKHYTPIHEKHVVPFVGVIWDLACRGAERVAAFSAVVYGKMVSIVEIGCPKLEKTLENSNSAIISFVKKECDDASGIVNALLLFFLVVLILIFRKVLWRTLKKIVCFPFKVLWYCTPLPLAFGKKRPQSPNKNEVTKVKVEGRQAQ